MVTRPVMASMAKAIRLNWRIVVIVSSGWRQSKNGRIAIMAFVVPPLCASLPQRYDKSLIRSSSLLAKVLQLETDIKFSLLNVIDLKALLPFEHALLTPAT